MGNGIRVGRGGQRGQKNCVRKEGKKQRVKGEEEAERSKGQKRKRGEGKSRQEKR
jgi:hypothetical protein